MVQIGSIRKRIGERLKVADIGRVLAGAGLLALSSQVRFWTPFSPVPITLQTLVVLLIGLSLGTQRAVLAVAVYIGAGLVGAPVFAGGLTGLAGLLGPTGGYLVGFLAAAAVLGTLSERGWTRRPLSLAAALLAAQVSIYAVGLAWLATFVGIRRAFALGMLPFLGGDLLKVLCVAGIHMGAHGVLRRRA